MHEPPKFLSVAKVAAALDGISEMTLYREIRADRFPAVRVGRRLFVPAELLTDMAADAMASRSLVDAADYVA